MAVIGVALLKSAAIYLGWVLVWQFALAANATTLPQVPWFVVPASLALAAGFFFVRKDSPASQEVPVKIVVPYVVCAGCLIICILVIQAWLTSMPPTRNLQAAVGTPVPVAVVFVFAAPVFAGLLEEVVFRGALQPAFIRLWGAHIGIVAVAVMFTIAHVGSPLFGYQWIGYLTTGLICGLLAYYGSSLAACLVLHGSVNLLTNIYVSVSGSTAVGVNATSVAVVVAVFALSATVVYKLTLSLIRSRSSSEEVSN